MVGSNEMSFWDGLFLVWHVIYILVPCLNVFFKSYNGFLPQFLDGGWATQIEKSEIESFP